MGTRQLSIKRPISAYKFVGPEKFKTYMPNKSWEIEVIVQQIDGNWTVIHNPESRPPNFPEWEHLVIWWKHE